MSTGNISKVILVGNLGHDPELRYTAKGNAVTSLSVATSQNRKNAAGEKEKSTTWHRATVFGRSAENCAKYLTKGAAVYVEGDLFLREWEDKEGRQRTSAEVLVNEIRFLNGRRRPPAPGTETVEGISTAENSH